MFALKKRFTEEKCTDEEKQLLEILERKRSIRDEKKKLSCPKKEYKAIFKIIKKHEWRKPKRHYRNRTLDPSSDENSNMEQGEIDE